MLIEFIKNKNHHWGELLLIAYPNNSIYHETITGCVMDLARENLRNFSHSLYLKCELFCRNYHLIWLSRREVPSHLWIGTACGYTPLASQWVNGADQKTLGFGYMFSEMGHSGDAFSQTSWMIILIIFVLIVLILKYQLPTKVLG